MTQNNWKQDINVDLSVQIGRAKRTIGDVLAWRKGQTIRLEDSKVNQLKIYINNEHVGFGSILKTPDGEMDLQINDLIQNKE